MWGEETRAVPGRARSLMNHGAAAAFHQDKPCFTSPLNELRVAGRATSSPQTSPHPPSLQPQRRLLIWVGGWGQWKYSTASSEHTSTPCIPLQRGKCSGAAAARRSWMGWLPSLGEHLNSQKRHTHLCLRETNSLSLSLSPNANHGSWADLSVPPSH